MVAPSSRVGGLFGVDNAIAWPTCGTDDIRTSWQLLCAVQERKALPLNTQFASPTEGDVWSAMSNVRTDAPGTAVLTQRRNVSEDMTFRIRQFGYRLVSLGFDRQLIEFRVRAVVINAFPTQRVPEWLEADPLVATAAA